MADRTSSVPTLTADILLKAYAVGMFPMAESADDPNLFWIEPEWRGIIPLDGFRIPRRLARTVRKGGFDVRVDTDFYGVVDGCAAPAPGREKTWINATIRKLYGELFQRGHCHTVESWQGGRLVGGLYGVSVGGAFFGESMFSAVTDASKVALVHLVARLRAGGYRLLDTQFVTDHLAHFGTIEIPKRIYGQRLTAALATQGNFRALPPSISGEEALRWLPAPESGEPHSD
ncbi:leucyl/phenylalanyl-tRNA--protein transferase [Pleomorphomonas carboxyditropha]|uniref:Leucyl/phenylalanyl-tRNA--protein transferase n=1 Tax=Pleomorphomonas carboxyditropha TaxID=2023338 RepID=A0A2G9WWM7_9HYPH|nr:leucyl/phenylalanyl-tRNA--protein transferase [Pleomorphomonas carboxyditropha]PIO99108.1 leucyl/phenylalanyl-tRNA--protein transferase [Pleomorphomonas carboxyditropha]